MSVSIAFNRSVTAEFPDAQVRFVVAEKVPTEAARSLLNTMQRVREIAGVTVLMFDRRSFDGAVRVDRLAPSGGPGSPDVHLPQSSLFRYSLNDVGDEALPHINAQAAVLPESMVLAVERLSATAVSTDGMVAAQDMLTAEVERWGATSTRCVIEAETPMTNLRAGEPGMFT